MAVVPTPLFIVLFQHSAHVPVMPIAIIRYRAHNTDGTSSVTTVADGTMRLFGTSVAVGKKAFVKDGEIKGEAPNLTYYEFEV